MSLPVSTRPDKLSGEDINMIHQREQVTARPPTCLLSPLFPQAYVVSAVFMRIRPMHVRCLMGGSLLRRALSDPDRLFNAIEYGRDPGTYLIVRRNWS
jgi:hypothetical protein